jgi:hypothetical protein
MRARKLAALSAAGAFVCCLLAAGCTSTALVRRGGGEEERPVENVAVLLFRNDAAGSPATLDELATDAFTLEIRKYFPAVVDRYRVHDHLASSGFAEGRATSPEALRSIQEGLEVDAVFVGTITGYGEKRTFLGWNGTPHFLMGCRLLSTEGGRPILSGRVAVTESLPLPVEDPAQMAVYGVRSLIAAMRLDERFGPPVLTRDDPLWERAMRDYEARRFWDAAEGFGALVALYRPGELRDEARICLGRSLEELGYSGSARAAYREVREGPLAPRALCREAEIAARAGETDSVLAMEARARDRFPEAPEIDALAYLSGVALVSAGRPAEAVPRLEAVCPRSSWRRFALYALAGPRLALGDTTRAAEALEGAAGPGAETESERRLADRAAFALGDLRVAAGDLDAADRAYAGVAGGEKAAAELARAWIAAERGRLENALPLVRAAAEGEDPRLASEALLLEGSCLGRHGMWNEAATSFRSALARCDAWEAEEGLRQGPTRERDAARTALAREIASGDPELLPFLLAKEGAPEARLLVMRNAHQELALRLERLDRELGPFANDPAARAARADLRERAEFSLAQASYEAGRQGVREAAWNGEER